GGIIKTIKEYEPLKDELGYLNKEFKEDNESKLFNDLCIATFVIRNQAITKLYGKEIGSKIEEHCLNICLKAFNQNSILLYEELKQIWLFSFDLDLVPHLEVCKKLYHRTCNRINQEYTENPLAEIALADLILNSQCGIWLRKSKAFKLIEDKQ